MPEFKDKNVQVDYDMLIMQRDDLDEELETVKRLIREIEDTAEREEGTL